MRLCFRNGVLKEALQLWHENGMRFESDLPWVALEKRRFEDVNFYETEAKLDAYEEEFSVALFVAPATLSAALSQTFNPDSMRRHSIR